jgi:cytidine deaminase
MIYLPDTDAARLLEEAREACIKSYSPYSHYAVGAAVLTNDGQIFSGTNIENASYGLTICAERIAVGNAVSAGNADIRAVAVYTNGGGAAPCGACRQFIIEFGKDIVIFFRNGNEIIQRAIEELLPYAFTKAALNKKISR